MQFLVLGHDGKDAGAAKRRADAQAEHIKMVNKLLSEGNLWYGAAMNDEAGNVTGSICMVNFASKDELKKWLSIEPYRVAGVWKKVEIITCNTRDPWRFNRPKEFFEGK